MNLDGCDVKSIMEIEVAKLTAMLQHEMEACKFAVAPPKQTREQKLNALKEKFNHEVGA